VFGGRARLSERGWGADRRAHSCGRGGPFFAWCAASITKAESRIDVDLILYLIYLILSLYLSISIYLSIYLSLAAERASLPRNIHLQLRDGARRGVLSTS